MTKIYKGNNLSKSSNLPPTNLVVNEEITIEFLKISQTGRQSKYNISLFVDTSKFMFRGKHNC